MSRSFCPGEDVKTKFENGVPTLTRSGEKQVTFGAQADPDQG